MTQCPHCKFCDDPTDAVAVAAQSVNQGKDINWVFVCDAHIQGWNDYGDWIAPVYFITDATSEFPVKYMLPAV